MSKEMIERGQAAREKVAAEVLPALVEAFPGKVEMIPPTNDQIPQVWATPNAALDIAKWLRNCGFTMLVDLTAADYYPNREPRFEVVYHFRQLPAQGMIRVRARVGEKESVPSLSAMWAMANPAEREVYDLFGIKFAGHPKLTRILNPDDWEGHPLRRDYPLRGPRALINLEMPAEQGRYARFQDENDSEGK